MLGESLWHKTAIMPTSRKLSHLGEPEPYPLQMIMLLLIQDNWQSSHLQRFPYSELLGMYACASSKPL